MHSEDYVWVRCCGSRKTSTIKFEFLGLKWQRISMAVKFKGFVRAEISGAYILVNLTVGGISNIKMAKEG